MQKTYITIKVGYTVGIYGCSNEFFNTIVINPSSKDNPIRNITYKGLYGTEDRIGEALKRKGYKQQWIKTDYGRMTKKDLLNIFLYEREAIELINNNFKQEKN